MVISEKLNHIPLQQHHPSPHRPPSSKTLTHVDILERECGISKKRLAIDGFASGILPRHVRHDHLDPLDSGASPPFTRT
ncbi:hypothetical protein J6590_084509 [Homalodisca vitripennis]|nr:hypothetical protein J6590_084509 [Homalodisca vitripennis]